MDILRLDSNGVTASFSLPEDSVIEVSTGVNVVFDLDGSSDSTTAEGSVVRVRYAESFDKVHCALQLEFFGSEAKGYVNFNTALVESKEKVIKYMNMYWSVMKWQAQRFDAVFKYEVLLFPYGLKDVPKRSSTLENLFPKSDSFHYYSGTGIKKAAVKDKSGKVIEEAWSDDNVYNDVRLPPLTTTLGQSRAKIMNAIRVNTAIQSRGDISTVIWMSYNYSGLLCSTFGNLINPKRILPLMDVLQASNAKAMNSADGIPTELNVQTCYMGSENFDNYNLPAVSEGFSYKRWLEKAIGDRVQVLCNFMLVSGVKYELPSAILGATKYRIQSVPSSLVVIDQDFDSKRTPYQCRITFGNIHSTVSDYAALGKYPPSLLMLNGYGGTNAR